MQVFRDDQLVASLVDDTATDSKAASGQLNVAIAANHLWAESNGTIRLVTEPRSIGGRTRIELTLTPCDHGAGWRPVAAGDLRYEWPGGFRASGVLRGFHTTAAGLPETIAFAGVASGEHGLALSAGHAQ